MAAQEEPGVVCPLNTRQLIDRVLVFVEEMSNGIRSANSRFYTYQKVFVRRIIESVILGEGSTITGIWSRQCVAQDQIVLNPDGSACQMKDAPGAWQTGSSVNTYRVKARGGHELDGVTLDHVFFTPDGEKQLRDLKVGDQVAVITSQSKWARKKSAKSTQREFVNMYKTEDVQVNVPLSSDFMTILGYMTADGYGIKAVRSGQSPKFTNIDPRMLDEFESLIQKSFKQTKVTRYEKGRAYDLVVTAKKRSVRPSQFARALRSLKWDEGFPPEVFETDKKKASLFLNRLFSSDGCVQPKRRSVELSCKNSLIYARYCQALLLKLGIRSNVKSEWMKTSHHAFFRLVITGVNNVLRFRDTVGPIFGKEKKSNQLFDDCESVAKSGIEGVGSGRVAKNMYPTVEKGRDGETVAWSKITEVEFVQEDEVWDREVPGKGWFTGQGFKLHNCGKSESVASLAVPLCVILPTLAREYPDDPRLKPFSAGFRVGIFAPVQDQANISFTRMRRIAKSEHGQAFLRDPEINIKLIKDRGDELLFSNGSEARCRSASPDTQIEGFTYELVIIDEAQKVLRSKVEKEIVPMMASTNGTCVKIGTAWESRGGFHTDIQLNIAQQDKGGKRDHFEFDYEMVLKEKAAAFKRDGNSFHLNYEKFIGKICRKLGASLAHPPVHNEEFKMNFMLLWAESRIIAIPPSLLMQQRDERFTMNKPTRRGLQVAGLDVAKTTDSSILTIMRVFTDNPIVDVSQMGTPHDREGLVDGEDEQNIFYMKLIIGLMEMQGDFEGNTGQYMQVLRMFEAFNVSIFAVDATTMGDPVFERFAVLLPDMEVIPYKFSTPKKSMLYRYYLQEWHANRVKFAADEDSQSLSEFRNFEAQHLDLDKVNRNGYVVCEAGDDGFDDYPDSGALACWAERYAKLETMPEVEVTHSVDVLGGKGYADRAPRGGRSSRYQLGRR